MIKQDPTSCDQDGGYFALTGVVNSEAKLEKISGSFLTSVDAEPGDLEGKGVIALGSVGLAQTDADVIAEGYSQASKGESARKAVVYGVQNRGRIILEYIFQPPDSEGKVYFSAYDVTHWQDEVDECLRLSDLFQTGAESAGIGFWFWYLESGEEFSTPTCNRFFGLAPDDSLSLSGLIESVHPDDRSYAKKYLMDAIEEEGSFDFQCRLVHDDGNVFWIALKGATFTGDAKGAGILTGSVQDINELKSVNKELERIYKLERKARDQAELANKTKDYFLAIVSHELRSPLNSILGWTKVLINNDVDEETGGKALNTIERSARAQARLIEDLLDSASITSGRLKLDKRKVNVFHVLEEVVNSFQPTVEQKGIELTFSHSGEDAFVNGDSARLRQVFSNLLGNASKFTPRKGSISCALRVRDEEVSICFEDTGRGIRKEHLPLIFDRFRQADEVERGKFKGLGLGLSIVKILVEEHGGNVSAESEGRGKGARFTVRLPLASSVQAIDREKEKNASTMRVSSEKEVLHGIRVLIVEDDIDSRKVLEIFLKQMGARVRTASSVEEAFESLDKNEDSPPNIVISDLGMPESDGFDLVMRLRESDRFGSIPAIALSAFSSFKYREKAMEAGFQIYHTKPFAPDKLCTQIAQLVKLSEKKRTESA
ncbi:MAG: response regulator [Acidobacteria bacterium]|nr:MAG: response regulator [Acidobacteriota bacterium]REK02700.1 MAG: response regulator [Acidobacteriota bacterium]REK13495.1 MAG: response regulator [Acidobacteriota bacterium]REK41489.1 MAG: response regulator [Acidobacteriota bacterium]